MNSTRYFAPHAWLPEGLAADVLLVEQDGQWVDVVPGSDPQGAQELRGLTIPGLANCHSHAFHRALRGRTHGDGGTFWTWRERMYTAAARLTPELYRELAMAVYAEMALAGVSAVAEFHYVHHQGDGTPYADPQAMDEALQDAARAAGVRLTLLDTCYLQGGLEASGHVPLAPAQARFGDGDVQRWAARHAQLVGDENTVIGAAIHSVRAVSAEDMRVVVDASEGQPLHAHISEQPAENEACQAHYQASPMEVLSQAGAVTARFTAVHATHLSDHDIELLGAAGATACFCPSTERDLADGIGPAPALLARGAQLSLGTDQHAMIDLFDEARALELHERLITHRRGTFSPEQLLAAATNHASIGWTDAGRIVVGGRADAVTVSLDSPQTAGCLPEQAIMAASAADVHHVVTGGRIVVRDGVHALGDVGRLLASSISTVWEEA